MSVEVMEQVRQARAKALLILLTALEDPEQIGISDAEIMDDWNLCVRIDGVDLAFTVRASLADQDEHTFDEKVAMFAATAGVSEAPATLDIPPIPEGLCGAYSAFSNGGCVFNFPHKGKHSWQ